MNRVSQMQEAARNRTWEHLRNALRCHQSGLAAATKKYTLAARNERTWRRQLEGR